MRLWWLFPQQNSNSNSIWNWESSTTARKEKKKAKRKWSTRKKIIYDHAAPQVWKKTLNVIENV